MGSQIPVVWLASYPRSGVTFLRLVIERLYGVPTYTTNQNEWTATGDLFPAGRLYPFECFTDVGYQFVKTHSVIPACGSMPAIHLVRDPRDTMVSYAHFLKNFRNAYGKHWEILEQVIAGSGPSGSWGQHLVTWLGRPTQLIHFDDLVADPVKVVTDAVEALNAEGDLGLMQTYEDAPTFDTLKASHPKFFRSGQSGQWRDEFPPYLLDRFENMYGAAIRAYQTTFGKNIRGERVEKREVA